METRLELDPYANRREETADRSERRGLRARCVRAFFRELPAWENGERFIRS